MGKTKNPKYMRRDDAAVLYGFSPRQFRRYTEKGLLPTCYPAAPSSSGEPIGPAYVRIKDVERFLAKRTVNR
jgi:hypothetical protein